MVIISVKLDFNCIFIFFKWDIKQRMEKSKKKIYWQKNPSPFFIGKLLCRFFFFIPQIFCRDCKQKIHNHKKVFLYDKTMHWKKFQKTYKKAVLIRFPDQKKLDKYLSLTSEQFVVCPFPLMLWPEGTKKIRRLLGNLQRKAVLRYESTFTWYSQQFKHKEN